MQLAHCTVRKAGDLNTQIPRLGVTVPELVVLREIHGADAVADVRPSGDVKRTVAEEIDRLKRAYDPIIVGKLFPGYAPILPSALEDIGFGQTPAPESATKAA